MRHWPEKPDLPPSNDVYITPTSKPEGQTSSATVNDYWMFEGRRVKEVLSELTDLPESRIEMPVTIDPDARFDMTLVPPSEQPHHTMRRLMTHGIAKHFGVVINLETRETDVHVLSAPNGLRVTPEPGGGFSVMTFDEMVLDESSARARFMDRFKAFSGRKPGGLAPARSFSMSGHTTTTQLCRVLEGVLGRPVIDDSGSGDGSFEMNVSTGEGTDGLLSRLRDEFGFVVTPERRAVEWLVVKPRSS